ncbi:MAG: hypothetical protein EBS08_07810, partial [Cytophagia bacterium]|nr:hypothetical protein [Cytophagia bacterium]
MDGVGEQPEKGIAADGQFMSSRGCYPRTFDRGPELVAEILDAFLRVAGDRDDLVLHAFLELLELRGGFREIHLVGHDDARLGGEDRRVEAEFALEDAVVVPRRVKLKVTNAFGSDSLTRNNFIRAKASACISGATDSVDTRIASFAFAGTTINFPTGTGNCATYTDRTGTPPFQVTLGQTYAATIVKGTCGGNYAAYAKVFIDFNRNYQFEGSELVMEGSLASTANASLTLSNISIAAPNASAGLSLLRVVVQEGGSSTLTQACGTYQWGETQDYMVQVNGGATLQPVSGVVTYNNSANSPLSSVNVRLLTVPGGVQDAQTTTVSNGTYSINAYTNGVRSFSLNTARVTGGINAT